ncbi:MAG: hypothetical protein WA477_14120 [Candidatus Sulfotelmatobacter sp.]
MSARNVATARKASQPGTVIAFPENLMASGTELGLTPAQQRTMAIAAGDLHIAVRQEVIRLLEEHKNNPLSVAKYGLERLRAEGQLTEQEFISMSQICDAVFAAQRGKIDSGTAYATVRRVYDQLLVDGGSSPMALAIASVASGALASNPGDPRPAAALAASRSNGDIGLVGGVIVGGIIGGVIGGAGGAIIGGVIGGIVGGVAGACTKS